MSSSPRGFPEECAVRADLARLALPLPPGLDAVPVPDSGDRVPAIDRRLAPEAERLSPEAEPLGPEAPPG